MLEDAAYRRMLDLYYAAEKPLPINRQGIYRLVRARSKTEQLAVDVVLGEFFTESEQGWRNARADAEIAKAQEKSQSARESAGKRWQSNGNAKAMRTHSEGNAGVECEGNAPNNQKPITNNQEPKRVEKPRSQGSRLPAGWFPSESLKAWAEKERSDLEVNAVIASFRDYWIAVPGSRGLKLDWDATFRNWVRKERQGVARKEINYDALVARIEEEDRQRAGN